jgi:hypothetical protein
MKRARSPGSRSEIERRMAQGQLPPLRAIVAAALPRWTLPVERLHVWRTASLLPGDSTAQSASRFQLLVTAFFSPFLSPRGSRGWTVFGLPLALTGDLWTPLPALRAVMNAVLDAFVDCRPTVLEARFAKPLKARTRRGAVVSVAGLRALDEAICVALITRGADRVAEHVGPVFCFKVELSPRAPTRLQAGPPGAALEALPASGPDRLDYAWGALEAWLDGVDRLSVEGTFLWPSAHERLAIWRRAMETRCVQRDR